jgi:predicted HicB family RNase H-like nuclease
MIIKGVNAIIGYDPEIDMFRGEFVGLNGGADFYADDIAGLKREGLISLEVFLESCKEDGVDPFRQFSGKLNLRMTPETHEIVSLSARSRGESINAWIVSAIKDKAEDRQSK